ncbi:MAG: hypothetical protein F6K58_08395 [Symploca sp. SIO2E9]|nr:hypothetical protein [Symploca sp. SIO2E9]
MFSTILKEVTSYFDRRALISAVFPSLVFWGLTLVLVVSHKMGWSTTLKGWEGLSGIIQGLLLIGFFVWVAFWSFLTINFRPALVRLYEGYWSELNPLIRILKRRRRRYWQQRWDKLDRSDRQLQELEEILTGEKIEYQQLRDSLVKSNQETQPDSNQAKFSEKTLSDKLNKLEKDLQSLKEEKITKEQLQELQNLGQQVRSWWQKLLQNLKEVRDDDKSVWNKHRDRLQQLTNNLKELVQRHFGEVEEERLRLNQEFFLYYPPHRDDVMPTQLGNILKAAERSVQERYQLDAILIWTRLQPALPNEFVQPMQDAKMSLDLMVTLSGYILLFGLPLSIWLSFQSSTILPWWISLVLVVLSIFLRFNVSLLLALSSLSLSWLISLKPTLLVSGFIQLQISITLTTAVLLAAWLSYQNAVQAAVAYGEKIKAAFDLYRWKALEGLHLQLPPNHQEERKMWQEVCGLLYRSYPPDPRYYRYVKQANTKDPVSELSPTFRLPVPKQTLPAYHLITADDIKEKEIPEAQVPGDALRHQSELIGYSPLQLLPANQPVSRFVLTEPKYLKDTMAVGIPATPAMTLGGNLKAGDVIDITLVPVAIESEPQPEPVTFSDILVLDVKLMQEKKSFAEQVSEQPFVVVIALPTVRRLEFATQSAGVTVLLTRKH